MTDITAQDASATTVDDRAIYTKVMWRLIPFLLTCYVVAYLDRVNVGFAKLQMLSELGFSELVYGLGAGIFFIGYVIFEIPGNFILIRVGPRLWISRIMITWGVISALTMLVKTPMSFYVFRFLLGAAEAGFIPAILYYLTIWFPSSQRGKTSSLFLAGIPLSGIIGGPLSGWIMSELHGSTGLAGWQWMFLLESIPAIILGIVCYLYLDDHIDSADWLTGVEKEKIKADISRETREKKLHSFHDGLLNGRVWLLSFTYFFFTLGLYGLSFWLPSIIKESGVKDPLSVGMLTAIPYFGALVVMFLVARSSDRHQERRWHLALPALVGAAGLMLSVSYAHNPVLALVALTIAAMGALTCIPQFYTLPPAILSGGAAAMGLAVANSVGSIAGFVSPYLLGWFKELTGSTDVGIMLLAGGLVLGALLVFANPPRLVNR
ncbi:MFS transporter [Bradyrhizobium australafricanum]|uniref:MFS transporter n=1 Tax=Bradyrhizobium australafricanum TaxID=2821406 RepID=UPI001CE2D5C3|nr:MFS transporter [Bradyrhizobium australafricanum]MCA6104124.1 MFS transporter [Bradyrhizobium australafricanum]